MNVIDGMMANLPLELANAHQFQQIVQSHLHCGCDLAPTTKPYRFETGGCTLHATRVVLARSERPYDLVFEPKGDALICIVVISGGLEIVSEQTLACRRGDAFAIATQSAWRASASPGTHFCALVFPKAEAGRMLERLGGQPLAEPLALAARFGSASSIGRVLAALVTAAITGTAGDEPLQRSSSIGAMLQDAMIALLLENLPHNHTAGMARHRTDAAPWPVRQAVDFILANARRDIGVGEVAAAAGMSLRALQQNFQRFFQAAPQDYIKAIRLQGVRRELLDIASRRSIEEIAVDWGFVNRGHFATQYRKAYGELPSETRRSR